MSTFFKKFLGVIVLVACAFVSTEILVNNSKFDHLKNELVFIDSSIDNVQNLIHDVQSSQNKDIQIIAINTANGFISQITQELKKYQNLDAIHLISHGKSGALLLGSQTVNENFVLRNAKQFSSWSNSLKDNGDILLYGCDVSKGSNGKQFIKTLADITGANVHASNNSSGIQKTNQDWVLEDSTDGTKYPPLIVSNENNRFTSSLEFINGNAFLNAENVIAGIGPDGAFGSNVPAPSGIFQGSRIGYSSDPSKNAFAGSYDGDFFLPGFPEEGWAVRVNGVNYNNNSNSQVVGIDGELTNYQELPRLSSVDWEGEVDQLEIRKIYRTYNKGLGIVTDVELKNTSSTVMKDVYYMRTVDPDNNVENTLNPTETFETKNTILYQGGTGLGAAVSASQFDGSIVTLAAYSEIARVAHGLQQVRDPVSVYSGTGGLNTTGSKTEDSSISLALKFNVLLPGEVVRFTTYYALAPIKPTRIELDDDDSSGLANGSFKQVYLLGSQPKPITDEDVTITGETAEIIEGLKVRLTNPSDGDRLRIIGLLPLGISVDTDEINDDFEINLKGPVIADEYIKVLKIIRFDNQKLDANLVTREIIVQVLDEEFGLSNGIDAQVFMTVPLVINENIAGDSILNKDESLQDLLISGTTAPNSEVVVTLTDLVGTTVTDTVVLEESNTWEFSFDPAKLELLEEGLIRVDAKATDQFGNVTSSKAEFTKDTQVHLDVTSPEDGSTIAGNALFIVGNSDPFSKITVTMPNGDVFNSTAFSTGVWSITVSNLGLDFNSELSLSLEAIDPAKNVVTSTLSLKTPPHPVAFTSLDADVNNIANTTSPVISGTSLAGTNITVTITTNIGSRICNATTDSSSNWSCQLPVLESGGAYPIRVESEDTSNEAIATANETLTIPNISLVIDEPLNNAIISGDNPLVLGSSDPEAIIVVTTRGGITCTDTADNTGKWSCNLTALEKGEDYLLSAIATDAANNEATDSTNVTISNLPLIILSPAFNETVENDTPSITGKTDPVVEIIVTTESGAGCTTLSDENGDWSCQLDKMPIGGPYDINILAKDNERNIETTVPWRLAIPDIPLIVSSPKENDVINGSSLTIIGTTNPNANVTVRGANGQECTATSSDTGTWSCDLNGLISGTSQLITITSIKDGKEKQLIRTIDLFIELLVSQPKENEVVTTSTLTVIGTTDPNSNVTVEGANGEQCVTTSNISGAWSCDLVGLLTGDGLLTITSVNQNNITKEVIRLISILINDGVVETVVKGGGSFSEEEVLLFFFLLLLLQIKANRFKSYVKK